MKKNIIIALIATILVSCSLETDNYPGVLEGMWHLRSMRHTSSTGQITTTDFSHDRIYWLFQGKLLQLEDKSGTPTSILYRFKQIDGKLELTEPYIYDRQNGDRPLTDESYLRLFGIQSFTPTYTISFNRKNLELSTDSVRLTFIKF